MPTTAAGSRSRDVDAQRIPLNDVLARPGPATLILGTTSSLAVLATSGTAPDQAVARTAAAAPSPLIAPALSRR